MNKIKALFLEANPVGTNHLQLDEEIRLISEKLRASEHRDMIDLVSAWAVRPDDLLQLLNQHKPQIVHFSGHGRTTGEIILVDNTGNPKPIATSAIRTLFRALKDNIRLVILNACYSRAQAEAIVENVDCAIGMNIAIHDTAAIIFAASFYRAIGFGRSIQEAYEQGKTALQLEGITEDDTPALLVRKGVDPSRIFLTSTDSIVNPNASVANLFQATHEAQDPYQFRGSLQGMLQVLQERLLRRTIEQLDPSVRRYETMRAVEAGCKALASKIKANSFIPDMIIGWRDRNREYRGSETVADLLSRELEIPLHIIMMQEIRERRQVVEECNWFRGTRKALIVDDACYSGSTLKNIQSTLAKVNLNAETRFAVLTTIDPNKLPDLYYISIHSTEELLFPWGWSRLIVGFYDIYQLFGIPDRHTIWSENTEWGSADTLVRNFSGNVRLLMIEPNKEMWQDPRRELDTFLYFLSGSVDVHIGTETGTFNQDEYLFIPRSIGYSITARDTAKILELLSGSI